MDIRQHKPPDPYMIRHIPTRESIQPGWLKPESARDLRPSTRVLLAAIVTCIGIGFSVGFASAFHVHTIGHIEHGIGDGADHDNNLHPYLDVVDSHNVKGMHFKWYRDGVDGNSVFLIGKECVPSCQHLHSYWDATDWPDQCYFGYFHTHSQPPHELNNHSHVHHDGFRDCSA